MQVGRGCGSLSSCCGCGCSCSGRALWVEVLEPALPPGPIGSAPLLPAVPPACHLDVRFTVRAACITHSLCLSYGPFSLALPCRLPL
jgi:hypothetical protein